MVSRQNLPGLSGHMQRDGHVAAALHGCGRHVWQDLALPEKLLWRPVSPKHAPGLSPIAHSPRDPILKNCRDAP